MPLTHVYLTLCFSIRRHILLLPKHRLPVSASLQHIFYFSVMRFQIFRVNRGTWLVNSCHVKQTQTSVYFGTDVLQWSCSTRASPPWRDDITEGITYVITRVSAKAYVCFLCERTQAICINPSSLKQCQKYTEPCHQPCHLCRFVSLGSFS